MSRRIEYPKCGTMNRAGTVCECYGGPDQRLVQPWVGKLRHSRELCDDWGFIRDESGKLIITVPVTVPHEEWAEHRRNNTDPTQPIVDAILDALNGPNKELTDRACEVRSSGS